MLARCMDDSLLIKGWLSKKMISAYLYPIYTIQLYLFLPEVLSWPRPMVKYIQHPLNHQLYKIVNMCYNDRDTSVRFENRSLPSCNKMDIGSRRLGRLLSSSRLLTSWQLKLWRHFGKGTHYRKLSRRRKQKVCAEEPMLPFSPPPAFPIKRS